MSENEKNEATTNEDNKKNESGSNNDNRSNRRGGGRRGGGGGGGRRSRGGRRRRRRGCPFKVNGKCEVDYKDVDTLRMYLTDTGKIRPRRQTQACSKCQRALATAIKRARFLALLPYAPQHLRSK